MGKSVKVHDDTHKALKQLKSQKRSKSLDEVVRDMIELSTGAPVEKVAKGRRSTDLTVYMKD